MDHVNKNDFFDINKFHQMFNMLLKDKRIKLSNGYKVLLKEEIKKYSTFGHIFKNCACFGEMIKKAIK